MQLSYPYRVRPYRKTKQDHRLNSGGADTGMTYRHSAALIISMALLLATQAEAGRRAAGPSQLPLLQLTDIVYQGAFRLPAATYGSSSLNYSQGPIAYNPTNHSIFIIGHAHHQQVAEFPVPGLVRSSRLEDLEMAAAPTQSFAPLLNRTSDANPQSLDRIGGLEYVTASSPPQLVVNCYEYYDAPGDNTQTTLLLNDSRDLAGAEVDGFFSFNGGAGHTSGWISPIPPEWQELLDGTHITGQSSGIPIISRTSVGPSAFAFTMNDLTGRGQVAEPIPTTSLLDFSLTNPLHEDLSNTEGDNDLWTHLSRVVYGMVVPGTRTYLTIGQSGGHRSGVCYKCTQDDGHLCGGYCPPEADDYAHYYWLWDVNDLVKIKQGQMNSYDGRPYAYGVFPTPFQTKALGGGTYAAASGLLYLTVQRADRAQGTYSNPPVVVAYSLQVTPPAPDTPPGQLPTSPGNRGSVAPRNYLLLK